MKAWIRIAMLAAFALCGTVASPAASTSSLDRLQSATPAAVDNMTPYRTLAADTLKAFKANDMATARKKAKELEKAWDNEQKDLKKKSSGVWTQIDKAMDDFIKPIGGKAPDAVKVQAAYDTFIAKLQLAVKSPEPQR